MTKPMRHRLRYERGSSNSPTPGVIAIIVAIALIGGGYFTLFAGKADTATNEVCLAYSGGWFEDKEFKEIVPPGRTKASIGIGSECYHYRIDERSWVGARGFNPQTASENGNPDAPEVIVTGGRTQDDEGTAVAGGAPVELLVEYQLYFTVNRSEDVLKKFHERLGTKTKAWETDGWRALLKTYFQPQIERALEAAALEFPWNDLYDDAETRNAYEERVVALLKSAMVEVIGGDFFCSPAYVGEGSECGDFTMTVSKPSITNQAILDSLAALETARNQAAAQETANSQTRTALEVEAEIIEMYGVEGALLREAIKSGKVTSFIIAPDGSIQPAVPTQAPGG